MYGDEPLYDVPKISSIQDMLLRSAKTYAYTLAMRDLQNTPIPQLTYNELLHAVLKFGAGLRSLKLKERSHIAVLGDNRIQWAITYLTSMCFNYVIIPVDKNLGINEILNILHESDSIAVVFSESFEPLFLERRRSMKKLKYYISMDRKEHSKEVFSMTLLMEKNKEWPVEKFPEINPEEMALILFTSGTLGRAKAVMLSQRNIASNLVGMTSLINITPKDRFLSVLPIHHTYECTCGILCPLFSGSSIFFARGLKTVVEDLLSSRATILLGVPLLYDKMFKRIYKSIHENRIQSFLVPSLMKAGKLFEFFGWKSF